MYQFSLQHRVRVYVFQVGEIGPRFLLLRQKPAAEWPFGPVVGSVGVGDHLQDTILREVREETGIEKPLHVIDLRQPSKELFGDVGLVEWPFAYQAGAPHHAVPKVVPGPRIGEFLWLDFERAFEHIESKLDRDNLVRLHLRLQQAG